MSILQDEHRMYSENPTIKLLIVVWPSEANFLQNGSKSLLMLWHSSDFSVLPNNNFIQLIFFILNYVHVILSNIYNQVFFATKFNTDTNWKYNKD